MLRVLVYLRRTSDMHIQYAHWTRVSDMHLGHESPIHIPDMPIREDFRICRSGMYVAQANQM